MHATTFTIKSAILGLYATDGDGCVYAITATDKGRHGNWYKAVPSVGYDTSKLYRDTDTDT